MKKIIIILLCIVVLLGGVGIYYFYTQKKELQVENVLPEGPLAYIRINDVEKNLKKMSSIPFWQAIGNINYDLLIEKSIIDPKQGMLIKRVKTLITQTANNQAVKRLFGKELAVAVYPMDQNVNTLVQDAKAMNPQVVEGVLSGLVFVTRMEPDVQFAEFFSRFFDQVGANISQGQVEYEGQIIRTVTLTNLGIKFGFVRLKDLLVIGIGETAARKSIETFKNIKPSLEQDPQFMESRSAFLDPSAMIGFFDFGSVFKLLKGQADALIALGDEEESQKNTAKQQWEEVSAKTSGLKTFAFSSQLGPVLEFKNRLFFDPNRLDKEYAFIYTCPSRSNTTVNFIPKDILGYQWSDCFDLDYYWNEIKKGVAQTGAPETKIDDMEAKIGLSVENDILPAFGDEIGGYVSDIQTGGFFPVPKLLIFVKIKDRAKAEFLLQKLQEKPITIFQDENYNNVPIKYLALPLGEEFQPGYCFFKGYLLVSTSRQLLKGSIDASENSSMSLLADPTFKQINLPLTDKSRSIQFVKIGKVIEKIKSVIGWTNEWISAREKKAEAFKAGSQMPLEEVKSGISVKEDELQALHDDAVVMEDEVWNLESKGEDATEQKSRIETLKEEIEAKELELAGEYERKEELENILSKTDENAPDSALRQLYLDEIIFPLLDGLKSIDAYGLRVNSDKGFLESTLFLKLQK